MLVYLQLKGPWRNTPFPPTKELYDNPKIILQKDKGPFFNPPPATKKTPEHFHNPYFDILHAHNGEGKTLSVGEGGRGWGQRHKKENKS